MTDAVEVTGGHEHSIALKADGTVVAWGSNSFGQTNVPAGLGNVIAIAAGDYHCVALKADGTLATWGSNSEGQRNLPVNLANVIAIEPTTIAAWL